MDLTWAKPMNNGGAPILKYTVYRRCETTKTDWEEVAETDQNTYRLDDKKGLVYKHKYQYRVCAHNKAGEGAPGGPTPLTACRKRKCKYHLDPPKNIELRCNELITKIGSELEDAIS